jgi:hypothetical protein
MSWNEVSTRRPTPYVLNGVPHQQALAEPTMF